MMAGAVLTQNTAWTNVEKALARLAAAHALSPAALYHLPRPALADLIRPAGYFNVKARRLHALAAHLMEQHGGSISRMFRTPTAALRTELLGIHGVGKETADSILLYAARRPVFVVDAYTRRLLTRHQWIDPRADYDTVAAWFTHAYRNHPDTITVPLYNEYHALIVALAKRHCTARRPDCTHCPLRHWLPPGSEPGTIAQ
jgi:endonuclease-3 related protein